jgi:hypothetical protein
VAAVCRVVGFDVSDGPGMVVGPEYLQAPAYYIVSVSRDPMAAPCEAGGRHSRRQATHCFCCYVMGSSCWGAGRCIMMRGSVCLSGTTASLQLAPSSSCQLRGRCRLLLPAV